MKKCDSCGKILDRLENEKSFINKNKNYIFKNENEYCMIGTKIRVNSYLTKFKSDKKYMQRQMGKYKLDKDYLIYWECLLKSLNVKP